MKIDGAVIIVERNVILNDRLIVVFSSDFLSTNVVRIRVVQNVDRFDTFRPRTTCRIGKTQIGFEDAWRFDVDGSAAGKNICFDMKFGLEFFVFMEKFVIGFPEKAINTPIWNV